jgi:hypothetical protein
MVLKEVKQENYSVCNAMGGYTKTGDRWLTVPVEVEETFGRLRVFRLTWRGMTLTIRKLTFDKHESHRLLDDQNLHPSHLVAMLIRLRFGFFADKSERFI